ncbi:hypothetical protein HRG_004597 [Hirsutella rhossiliensis]|uniref:Protein kinase domain-containing protein n=1 Tax=Hirsutella rhossiliensis TaxID=111463 RepID=A0A9P8N1F4_9HYPO|nr:uncharacterized protein HRG_04597 [Hirsutella rhossiliensis]KAH0964169.1 hypothetical protein HRG_04597 [Hirsutella rhossiliensis]
MTVFKSSMEQPARSHVDILSPALSTPESSRSMHARDGPRMLSLGSTGCTFRLTDYVVVKKVRPGREANMAQEQHVFAILESHPPSPYIIRRFYRTEEMIFLEYVSNGDLASLLRDQQLRDDLSSAHCDIRPGNMLLCDSGRVKLADFDRTIRIRDDMLSGAEQFARLLGDEGGLDCGTYGKAGCRSEQFAIGSVFYSLTRGYDPLEDEWWGPDHGPIRMQKLQKMEFPPVGRLGYDGIIHNCWHDRYQSIADLSADIAALDQTAWEATCEDDFLWIKARIQECETTARSGILEKLITR